MVSKTPRVIVTSGKIGQLHLIYSLATRYQPFKFKDNLILGSIPTDEWLEAVEDSIGLFEMTNQEMI